MKSFTSFLHENTTYIPGGFNIARSEMPQIKDQEKFADYLENLGYEVMAIAISPKIVKPTQIEFDQSKVDALVGKELDPVIVSDDYFVLDGHHRYFAALQSGASNMTVYYVSVGINKLLKHAYEFLGEADG